MRNFRALLLLLSLGASSAFTASPFSRAAFTNTRVSPLPVSAVEEAAPGTANIVDTHKIRYVLLKLKGGFGTTNFMFIF